MISVTVIGFGAAFLTTFSFLPQVMKVWETKQTDDISLVMYVMFCTGGILWLLYGLLLNDVPIVAANAVTLALSSSVLYFKIKTTRQSRRDQRRRQSPRQRRRQRVRNL